jgi:hypothetical protein
MLGKAVENELQLLNFNNLEYSHEPVVSTVATREFSTHPARALTYTSYLSPNEEVEYKSLQEPLGPIQSIRERTILIDVPSGKRYIDPARSYMAFTVTVEFPKVPAVPPEDEYLYQVALNDTPFRRTPNEQSALPLYHSELWTNLFQSARWIHCSKSEIDYVQRSDHESYLYTSRQSSDWHHSVAAGYRRSLPPHVIDTNDQSPEPDSETHEVLIPLSVLFPSWREKKKLLPPQLVAGSMFELVLNTPQDAFSLGFERQGEQSDFFKYTLVDSAAEAILLGFFRFHVRNARVVLDEREMLASIDSLMWNTSVVAGTPIQVHDSTVQVQRQPMPEPVGPGGAFTISVPEGEGKSIISLNLSRLDDVATSILLEPSNIVLDLFLPKLRAPELAFSGFDRLSLNEYRFKSGYRYWPNKEPTFSREPDPGNISKDSFLRWCSRFPSVAMTYGQWRAYINAFFMCFRRAQFDSTTGVAITNKRPMQLTYAFKMDALNMPLYREAKNQYVLRHLITSCRYSNVFGNQLQLRN